MFRRNLDSDGILHEEFIEDIDGFVIKTTQDVRPILERNAEMRRYRQTGNARLAASIPIVIWDRWMKETNGEITHNMQLLAAKLNSPEFAYLKTMEGKI